MYSACVFPYLVGVLTSVDHLRMAVGVMRKISNKNIAIVKFRFPSNSRYCCYFR